MNARRSSTSPSLISMPGSNVRRSTSAAPFPRSDRPGVTSRRTRSPSGSKVVLSANDNTAARSRTISPPPVATRKSRSPFGRTASRRSVTSTVTVVTGDQSVDGRNSPTGSATGSRERKCALVCRIARWTVSFSSTSRKYIPVTICSTPPLPSRRRSRSPGRRGAGAPRAEPRRQQRRLAPCTRRPRPAARSSTAAAAGA